MNDQTIDDKAWKFVDLIAQMKTTEEFGDDLPEAEDWSETLDNLIASARKLQKERNK